MPNYVHVEPKPFEADYYYGPEQYEDFGGPGSQLSREKSAAVKLRVDNTLRWRWVKDKSGNYVRLPALQHDSTRIDNVYHY